MRSTSFFRLLQQSLYVTVLLTAFGSLHHQDARAQVALRLPELQTGVQQTFTIEVEVGSLTGRNVFGFALTIGYDASVLEILRLETEGTVAASLGAIQGKDDPENGTYKIAGAGANPASGSGTLVKLIARGKTEGTSPLAWAKSELNTYNPSTGEEGTLQVQTTNGHVQVGTGTANEPDSELPSGLKLHQNMPNPFNPSTRIGFEIPASGRVQLVLHDLLGRRVRTLLDSSLPAGAHAIEFDAANLPSGLYFYTLTTASGTLSRSMHLAK